MSTTVVIKVGGGDLDIRAICVDVGKLIADGYRVLVVHGGAAELDRLAKRLDVPQRRLQTPSGTSSRYTDPATLEVLTMAMAGKVKPAILAELARAGVRANGLTGIDSALLTAKRSAAHRAVVDGRTVLIRNDHSGRITHVDPAILHLLLDNGFVPVVSPPALDHDGVPVNVDADRIAVALAAAIDAELLIFLTGAPGLLADPADEETLIAARAMPSEGPVGTRADGGMSVKLLAARDALVNGATAVLITDGRCSDPLTRALAGAGTRLTLSR